MHDGLSGSGMLATVTRNQDYLGIAIQLTRLLGQLSRQPSVVCIQEGHKFALRVTEGEIAGGTRARVGL